MWKKEEKRERLVDEEKENGEEASSIFACNGSKRPVHIQLVIEDQAHDGMDCWIARQEMQHPDAAKSVV